MSARVYLGGALVGELTPDPAARTTSFEFDAAYAADAARPVLGRWFEDRDITPPRAFSGSPLPSYFRNLLPEGTLRRIVEARLGASALPEYAMLLRLGGDLPGAVRVVGDEFDPDALDSAERQNRAPLDPFRFALTGMQPKLPLEEEAGRLTVPVEGREGFWIAKFGSPGLQKLVENEHMMLRWAKACGLDVPHHRIVAAGEIENLPEEFEPEQNVLLVRRFDRTDEGRRIHQEDFAQVFGIDPEDRYTSEVFDRAHAHYGTIGAVVLSVCGKDDYREYLRRLVFMVLSGNADMHLKNWALTYGDALRARLAPVYDFVATVAYPNLRAHPALRWVEPAAPTADPGSVLAAVTMDDILAAASYTDDDTGEIMDDLSDFASKVRTEWIGVADEAPAVVAARVSKHLAAVRLE